MGVLLFSAIPFTAVKAIANSSVGERLRRRLEETKRDAVESSKRFKAMAKKAREERFSSTVNYFYSIISCFIVMPCK